MSVKNGVWHNAALEIPPNERTVLAVKELKNGRREICLAYCIPDYTYRNHQTGETRVGPYWCCGGNNNIIWWMPLPAIPEKNAAKTQQDNVETDRLKLKDCANELCMTCANYVNEHLSACEGCRWKAVRHGDS